MPVSEESRWSCQGCGVPLDPDVLDTWCHHCLDELRRKLARQLSLHHHDWGGWGWAYGPSLAAIWQQQAPQRPAP
jgi:hypothetical protein